ncbi:MAG TPA: hypothetical protein PKD45_08405 [Flavobacteriales bacterium]|nr:hypothetical protein [Flavobacteriales bacterium]
MPTIVAKTMGWGSLPLLLTLLSTTPAVQCNQPRAQDAPLPDLDEVRPATPADAGTDGRSRPFFGFNAKGNLNPEEQVRYANAFLDQITSPDTKKDLVIRVTGGTVSQTTYSKDWSTATVAAWTALQKRQGVRFIYVVNGNEPPAAQAANIQRWMDAGARFDLLEMMNEYYLPKFAKGDRSFAEVSGQVSPEKYVNTILPAYWKELDRFGLPYYLIFAPAKGGGATNRLGQWNQVVADAIRNKYPGRQLNATIHLYADGNDLSTFDYGQIDRLRQSLPPGRHIAVTEAGILDPNLTFQQNGQAAVDHYRNILKHLQAGDYLLDQVLYNTGKKVSNAVLSPTTGGETMKGKVMLQFIQGGLR